MPLLAFALVCFAAAELGALIEITAGGTTIPAFWPATGIVAGALAVTDRRRWISLAVVAYIAMGASFLLHGRVGFESTLIPMVAVLEAFLTAWFLRRVLDGPPSLSRVPHMWTLLGAAALVPAGGAVLAAVAPARAEGFSFPALWRAWWLMEALGILLAAPLAIAAITHRKASAPEPWSRRIEMVAAVSGAALMAIAVFGDAVDPVVRIPAYLLPFFLWAAFRLGPGTTAAAALVVCTIGLWNTAQGHGPFALPGAGADAWILRSQGTVAIAGMSFLLLATVVAERKRVTQENAMLIVDLQQALADIKSLEGLIPICAWCHKVRDDAGFWQQIESYVGARTDATFSHGICPACVESEHPEIAAHTRR